MARYRIICTTQEPPQAPNDRAHVVAVGTGSFASTYDTYWMLDEVLTAMDSGEEFYTYGERSRKMAAVVRYQCQWCSRTHIQSSPDAIEDNNLDSLPSCKN